MLASFALSAALCAFLLWVMLRVASRLPQDVPNERSLHQHPVPRTGGIALLAGVGIAASSGILSVHLPLVLALGLALISFADDLHGLPTTVRLVAHLGAAAILVWYILSPIELWKLALMILAVTWITNLYNFMDGADGLAGGMSVIGFGTYAGAAFVAGDSSIATTSAALAGASAAFLAYNFHPARIFLGDVGSIPLGFLAASLGLVGWRNDVWPLWFPLLVFGPFIGDATVTLVRRVGRGGRFWTAHREHYYQRMVRMGFGHRRTAWIGYGAMAACAVAAWIGRDKAPGVQAALFGTGAALLAALAGWVDWRWTRYLRSGVPA